LCGAQQAVSGDELYGYMTLSKDWKVRGNAPTAQALCAQACLAAVEGGDRLAELVCVRVCVGQDGVLSIIMRGMSKNVPDQGFYEYQTYKCVPV
jgi:dynein heavy chain